MDSRPKRGAGLRLGLCAVAAAASLTSFAVDAAGTAAGTTIQNTAVVDFSIGGTSASTTSNSTSITVVEIINVAVTLQSPTISAATGATAVPLVFLVTNTGNSDETFELRADSALVGDDFDPTPSTPFVYLDIDASGDLSPTDTPYVAGSNDPLLAADASIGVIVVNDIPTGLADGGRGRSELGATAATGTGSPGTVFAGRGTGGVDALLGTSGGQSAVFGEYLVGDILISAVASQTVADPFGGTQSMPGAKITYQIVVSATGSGTAVGAIVADAVPSNTTYVPGSLRLNAGALTDATDGDAGQFSGPPTPGVTVALGDFSAASGPQTIQFVVTID